VKSDPIEPPTAPAPRERARPHARAWRRDLFLLDVARCHEGFADKQQNDVGTVQQLLDGTVPFASRNDVPVMPAQNQIAPGKQFQVLIQRVPRLFVLVGGCGYTLLLNRSGCGFNFFQQP